MFGYAPDQEEVLGELQRHEGEVEDVPNIIIVLLIL